MGRWQDALGRTVEHLLRLAAIAIAIVALVAGQTLVAARSPVTPAGLTGAATDTPGDLLDGAASRLDTVLAPAGTGFGFRILQRSTMHAKEGGPRIDVPDPADPRRTLRFADEYELGSLIEQGVARPDGFWSEMRAGPAPGKDPEWDKAVLMYEALVIDDERFRNDGDGWYQADALPGVGLDPETADLLSSLLRNATAPKDGEVRDGSPATRALTATGKETDIPGVVAADGAAFTKLHAPIEFGFDDTGRLVSLSATALNTNMVEFDLVIDTTITFTYEDVAELPQPRPLLKGAEAGS